MKTKEFRDSVRRIMMSMSLGCRLIEVRVDLEDDWRDLGSTI